MTTYERDIDIIINNYNNKGTIKNRLNSYFKDTDIQDLLTIHFIYNRSPETQEALKVLADSDEISEVALTKQKNKLAIQKFFNMFDAKNADDISHPLPLVLEEEDEIQDHDDYENKDLDKAKQLKEELIEIIKSNLQTNLDERRDDNYELDPEKVDYLTSEATTVNRNEEIINEIMKESDDQTTITRDDVTIADQPSELAKLASSLGEKYISLNLKGGPKVKIEGIGDSSVVEVDDDNKDLVPVIIGTEYVEKSTEETDKQKEEKEEE